MILKSAKLNLEENNKPSILIRFAFNYPDLEVVRSLPGRTYDSKNKTWAAPVNINNINALKKAGFQIDIELEKLFQNKKQESANIKQIEIPGLKGTLRPFQNIGVSMIDYFIKQNRHGALLADDMGTGKTIQSLAYLQLHPELRPAIIVCPASVKINWGREAIKWLSPQPKVQILYTETPYKINGDIIIINYNILHYWVETLKNIKAKIIILDECQKFKNNKAKQTKAVKQLSKKIPYRIPTSGTPIENRPQEIYNAWYLVDPDNCPTYWEFCMKFCDAKNNGYGWDFSGASNTQELHELLINSCMIRRLKKDVLSELPDKEYSFIPLEINNEKEYRFAENNFIKYITEKLFNVFSALNVSKQTAIEMSANAVRKKLNAETFAKIEELKQLASKGKLNQVINWIEDFLESDEKLVVFAYHKFVIEALMNEFNKIAVKIDGSVTSMTERQKAIDNFQTDAKTKLMIISEAGSEGINLTAAHNIAIVEYPKTPGKLAQIIDRTHRIGQTEKVMVYFLMAVDTIEDKLAKILDKKLKVINSVLDGTETDSNSLIYELIEEYKRKI